MVCNRPNHAPEYYHDPRCVLLSCFAICFAVTLCIGNVGCRLFSQKYSSTAYVQLTYLVYHVGVPFSSTIISAHCSQETPLYSLTSFAVTRSILVTTGLLIRSRLVQDLGEHCVRVEDEGSSILMRAAQVLSDARDPLVPGCYRLLLGGLRRLASCNGERRSVDWRDVEEEEVLRSRLVELVLLMM